MTNLEGQTKTWKQTLKSPRQKNIPMIFAHLDKKAHIILLQSYVASLDNLPVGGFLFCYVACSKIVCYVE